MSEGRSHYAAASGDESGKIYTGQKIKLYNSAEMRYYKERILCGYGGIGRRARFRFWCLRRAGSSPVIRRIKLESLETGTFQNKNEGSSHMGRTLFL